MSPPILHSILPVPEPIMQILNFLSHLKPPPRAVTPEEVSPSATATATATATIPDLTATDQSKAAGAPLNVIPEPDTGPRSGEEVTSPSGILEDATRSKIILERYPFLLRHPFSVHPSDMAPPPRPAATTNPSSASSKAPKSEYISTDTGNKVARRSQLHGTQHIILGGRAVIQPQVCIRGDLTRLPHPPTPSSTTITTTTTTTSSTQPQPQAQPTVSVSIGRYSFISSTAVLRPPCKLSRGTLSYHALRVGEHVFVGPGAVVEAAAIGDRVVIGEGSVVGRFAILKEGCVVLPGAVVPGGMVVPSGAVVGGRPARFVGEVGDGWEGGDLREMWRGTG